MPAFVTLFNLSCQSDNILVRLVETAPLGTTVCAPVTEFDLPMPAPAACGLPVLDANKNLLYYEPGPGPTALVVGDFNGDGNDDLVMGFPGCAAPARLATKGSKAVIKNAGAVQVCWGRPSSGSQDRCGIADWGCDLIRDPEGPQEGAEFGFALAAYSWGEASAGAVQDELVVGVPGWTDPVGDVRVGAVRGLVLDSNEPKHYAAWWSLASTLTHAGDLVSGARYGAALASGDFGDTGAAIGPDLAIGAPGYWLYDGVGGLREDVGAVEIRLGYLAALRLGDPNTSGPDPVAPPLSASVGSWEPMRVCNEAGYEDYSSWGCLASGGAANICDGARFGATLATGHFLAADGPGASEDLAIGAPGSPGAVGQKRSGHVEIHSGAALNALVAVPNPGPSPNIADDCDLGPYGAQYLDSTVHTALGVGSGPPSVAWDVWDKDLRPEEGDGYGSALHAADLVRTIYADENGHHRDELVIGSPGEDLSRWQSSNLSQPPWVSPPETDAGMFCIYQHPDDDLLSVYGPEIEGLTPAPGVQRCVGMISTEAVAPNWGPAAPNFVSEKRHVGTSVVAGRLSPWDPDFQVAVGAPGEVGHPDPGVDEGEVFVFHFKQQAFNGAFDLAVQDASGSFISGTRVDSVISGPDTTWVQPGATGAARPAGFGTAMIKHDLRCKELQDLIVIAPHTRGQTVWESVRATKWKGGSFNRQPDWSQIYRGTGLGAAGNEELAVAIVAPNTLSKDSGYVYLWSPSNYTPAGSVSIPGEDPCFSLPMNWVNLPGEAPFPGPIMPCAAGASIELPWSTAAGYRWAHFGPPVAAAHNRYWNPSSQSALWEKVDLKAWLEASSGGEPLLPLPYSLDSLDANLFLQKLDPSDDAGPIDLCLEINGVVSDGNNSVNIDALIDGQGAVNCAGSNRNAGEGLIRWHLQPEGKLSCDQGWVP